MARAGKSGTDPTDEQAPPVPRADAEASPDRAAAPFPVVGIGASAGGVQALQELLNHLPSDTGMAFVVVPHLDPTHASNLVEILARCAPMPVREVDQDGVVVAPDQVYVLAPDTLLTLSAGKLRTTPGTGRHRSGCIDHFLASLAASHQDKAVGVILSGTAADGSGGMRAIKAVGGTNFAQDDSAEFVDMPRNAIATGSVDFVLPPAGIAAELARMAHDPAGAKARRASSAEVASPEPAMQRVLRLLAGSTGVDFTDYKQTTVRRRLGRRMAIHRLERLEDYIQLLEDTPAEVRALHDDLLIHVTAFFRDQESFQALADHVFPKLVQNRAPDDPIRIWVPGCSSGEEVYSLAMALLEFVEERGLAFPIQLFGTDVSDDAVERGRAGTYTRAQVENVSPERLARFFSETDSGTWRVAKSLRDLCVFARQDLVRDPPFSRLDLISCRNVLIYLGQTLQKRVLPLFHYALKPGGFLLLGASESIGAFTQLFSVVDKTERIYQRTSAVTRRQLLTFLPETTRRPVRDVHANVEVAPFDAAHEADRVLLLHFVPASIVIDASDDIVHIRGETGPYLRPAPGKPSPHLSKMVREDLVLDLERALGESRATGVTTRRERVFVRADGQRREVAIEVVPLRAPSGAPALHLVVFRGSEPLPTAFGAPPGPVEDKDRELARLREELTASRSYHQGIVERYDGVNEDLRSAHEEVLSANEELQSTNEEMETAKEELQATNEELTTLNDELLDRNNELAQLNSDLENLFASVNVPIALVDANLRLRRITPLAGRLFNVLPTDLDRRITDFKHTFDAGDLDLEKSLTAVLETQAMVDREIKDRDGRWYALRIRPYHTANHAVDGAVIVFTDIHAVKTRLLDDARARAFLETVFRTVPEPILVLDNRLRVLTENRAFQRTFGAEGPDRTGAPFFEVDGGRWDIGAMRAVVEAVRDRNERFDEHPCRVGERSLLVSARRVEPGDDTAVGVLLVLNDVTERLAAETERRKSEERFAAIFNQAFAGIVQADLTGRIVLANGRFCEIVGRTEEQLRALGFADLAWEAHPRIPAAIEQVVAGAPGVVIEERLARADGTPVWVTADVSVSRDPAGKAEFVLVVAQDVAARKQAEEEVRALTDRLDQRVRERTLELEDVVRDLNAFTYSVSHDLRAPVRSMNAMSQLILKEFSDQVLDARGQRYLGRISVAAARMDALVLNLLAYSRLGRMKIELEAVFLDEVVEDVLAHLADDARRLGATVEVSGPLGRVRAHRATLTQGIENLLTNAMKFVPPDTAPRVRVHAEPRGGVVRLWVDDNGIGIAPEYQERIFGVFERLHGSETYAGTGIGLAIVRRAVERSGGNVGVESEPGRGSRFWIDLPSAQPE